MPDDDQMKNNSKIYENEPRIMIPGTDGKDGKPSADVLIKIWENMVQNCAVAIFVINSEHQVMHWNRACEELTGIKASDIIGTSDHWSAFYDHQRPTLSDLIINNEIGKIGQLYNVHGPSLLVPNGFHAEDWYPDVGGRKRYLIFDASPIFYEDKKLLGVVETLQDITVLKEMEEEKERLNGELREALNQIKTLSGLIPICAGCKKIRDDKGYWNQLEHYLEKHSDAVFSHGMCPDCFKKYFSEETMEPEE